MSQIAKECADDSCDFHKMTLFNARLKMSASERLGEGQTDGMGAGV